MNTEQTLEDALEIRRAALEKIEREGAFHDVPGIGRARAWKGDRVAMIYRTPFQGVPKDLMWHGADSGLEVRHALPYGLDVWYRYGGKVFSVEWDSEGNVELRRFRRGNWETLLLKDCSVSTN